MRKRTFLFAAACSVANLFSAILPADAQSNYRFDRMWPTLQQPWYFAGPRGVATDSMGNVYVTDAVRNRIVKLSADGVVITTWGSYGIGDGQF